MTYYLPIFPLPEAVLFPRTTMRLHVFEPRYVAMVNDAMAGERRFALGHLREGYQLDYFGAPPIYRISTAARILLADRMDDGRWNIIIEGIERVALLEEPQQSPYRIGHFEPLVEEILPSERDEVFEMARRTARLADGIADSLESGKRILSNMMNIHQHPGIVCDIITSQLVADHYAQQSILSERNILRRLRLLNIQLQHLAASMRGEGMAVELPPEN